MKAWQWLALAAAGAGGYVFVKKGGLLASAVVLDTVVNKLKQSEPTVARVLPPPDFPVGTHVTINSGERGVVTAAQWDGTQYRYNVNTIESHPGLSINSSEGLAKYDIVGVHS